MKSNYRKFYVRNGILNNIDRKKWKDEIDCQLSKNGWHGSAISSFPEENSLCVIEEIAYYKAIQTLKKIANEDFRGNRPQSAVDAYNTLKELGELNEK